MKGYEEIAVKKGKTREMRKKGSLVNWKLFVLLVGNLGGVGDEASLGHWWEEWKGVGN